MTSRGPISFHASCAVGLATATMALGILGISALEAWPQTRKQFSLTRYALAVAGGRPSIPSSDAGRAKSSGITPRCWSGRP